METNSLSDAEFKTVYKDAQLTQGKNKGTKR